MSNIENIDDHRTKVCECGSVHYNLLRSGQAENERLKDENVKLIGDIQCMVKKAVDNKLEGYREQGRKIFALENENERLKEGVRSWTRLYDDSSTTILKLLPQLSELKAEALMLREALNYYATDETPDGWTAIEALNATPNTAALAELVGRATNFVRVRKIAGYDDRAEKSAGWYLSEAVRRYQEVK